MPLLSVAAAPSSLRSHQDHGGILPLPSRSGRLALRNFWPGTFRVSSETTSLSAGSRLPEKRGSDCPGAANRFLCPRLHPPLLPPSLWVCLCSIWHPRGSGHYLPAVARPPLPASRLPHVVDTSIIASRQETASGRRTPGCQLHARSRRPHSSSARPLPLACKARSHLTFAACHPSLSVKWRSEILPWGCW